MWAHTHTHATPSAQTLRRANAERSEGSVSEVRATPQWKIHVTSASLTTHTHTHTHTPPHTHSCMHTHIHACTHQWQGSTTHGLLIRGWGFLQHRTMGSSPDCYIQALSISPPLFWQGMCWPFFFPYHRQTSSPRPGHTPSSPIKQSHLRGRSRGRFSSGDPIMHPSFTFSFQTFPGELHGWCQHHFPSFASFTNSLLDAHNMASVI